MHPLLKKYCSLFLLSIFLFAYTEKNVHDAFHANDTHCNAQHEKHFHDQEHHCFICDFDIPTFHGSTSFSASSFVSCATDAVFGIAENKFTPGFYSSYLNKGPPALV